MKGSGSFAIFAAPMLGLVAAACGNSTAPDTAVLTRDALLDPNTCQQCHQKHFSEWSGSMHAYASTDPIFRAMNALGQKQTQGQLGNFCVNCHAPMAVRENVTTDGSNLDTLKAKYQGVTCYFCHNVTDVTDTHNNPLVLANDVTMRGGALRPVKYKGHTAEYSKLFDDQLEDSSKVCGSCHDIVVPAHFSGATAPVALERTFTEWSGSPFAVQSDPNHQNCAGSCHMRHELDVPIANPPGDPPMPSRIRHQHDFPGVDTALLGDFPATDTEVLQAAQLNAITNTLSSELRIQACVDPSTNEGMDLTLENISAGHNFPSGASQDRRLWVEIHAYSDEKDTKEVYSSGVVPPGVAATTVDGTWLLRDETLKADGTTPAHTFWDAAIINRNTIPVGTPGDSVSVNMNTVYKHFDMPAAKHVTITVWLESIGLDVIDDLIAQNALDPSYRAKIPRFKIVPPSATGDAGASAVTFDWTASKAQKEAFPNMTMYQQCLQSGDSAMSPTLPPPATTATTAPSATP